MGNNGYDTPFTIHRKRNLYLIPFLEYLDGRDSVDDHWPNRDGGVNEPNDDGLAQLMPYGYRFDGAQFLTGNLGVNADTITQFTVAAIVSADDLSQNGVIVSGLFGATTYPRMAFASGSLVCSVKLDGTVRTVTVASITSYMKNGQPAMIVFRGKNSVGIEVLIDNVSVRTEGTTGTAYTVGSVDFTIGKESSTYLSGAIRGLFVSVQQLTNAQIEAWRKQLDYEGFFDVWRDNFKKWSGDDTFSAGVEQIASSAYEATIVEL